MERVELADNVLKCMSIRDLTTAIGRVLLEGGEIVVYKGKDPYRYMNIRPVKVVRGVIKSEEYEERRKESEVVQREKELLERL